MVVVVPHPLVCTLLAMAMGELTAWISAPQGSLLTSSLMRLFSVSSVVSLFESRSNGYGPWHAFGLGSSSWARFGE